MTTPRRRKKQLHDLDEIEMRKIGQEVSSAKELARVLEAARSRHTTELESLQLERERTRAMLQLAEVASMPPSANEFTSVGSLDIAVHTVTPFDSGPMMELLSEAPPHDLLALKERSINPARLGYKKPNEFGDEEFGRLVSSYASARRLDLEREEAVRLAQEARKGEVRKTFWSVAGPVVAVIAAALLAYFGLK